MTTGILSITELAENQKTPYVTVNEALAKIEAMLVRVLSRTNSGAPADPDDGDTYIVDDVSGEWATATLGDIAHYVGGGWEFYTPFEGLSLWVNDEDDFIDHDGTTWVTRGLKYLPRELTVPTTNGTWTPTTSGVAVFDLTAAAATLELDLAAPSFAGQELTILYDTGAEDLEITGPNDMNDADDIATFTDNGDWMKLAARKAGGVLEWRVIISDGVVWSGTLT